MTQQEFITQLDLKPIKGLESVVESVIEIAKQAYNAGFKEGTDVANKLNKDITEKVNSYFIK